MIGTMTITTFAANRLNGEPVPDDLKLLLENGEELFELTGIRLNTRKDWAPWLDTGHLTARERADPDVAADLRATAEVCGMIAFVAAEEDGHFIGYWRGPENRRVTECPLVVLDPEGQFEVCAGSNFAEALLSRVYGEERFQELREFLRSLGLSAHFPSPDDIPIPEVDPTPVAIHQELFRRFRTT